jgi:hypothetical protein
MPETVFQGFSRYSRLTVAKPLRRKLAKLRGLVLNAGPRIRYAKLKISLARCGCSGRLS